MDQRRPLILFIHGKQPCRCSSDNGGWSILVVWMDNAAFVATRNSHPAKPRAVALFKKPSQPLEDAITHGRIAAATARRFNAMLGGIGASFDTPEARRADRKSRACSTHALSQAIPYHVKCGHETDQTKLPMSLTNEEAYLSQVAHVASIAPSVARAGDYLALTKPRVMSLGVYGGRGRGRRKKLCANCHA